MWLCISLIQRQHFPGRRGHSQSRVPFWLKINMPWPIRLHHKLSLVLQPPGRMGGLSDLSSQRPWPIHCSNFALFSASVLTPLELTKLCWSLKISPSNLNHPLRLFSPIGSAITFQLFRRAFSSKVRPVSSTSERSQVWLRIFHFKQPNFSNILRKILWFFLHFESPVSRIFDLVLTQEAHIHPITWQMQVKQFPFSGPGGLLDAVRSQLFPWLHSRFQSRSENERLNHSASPIDWEGPSGSLARGFQLI